MNLHRIRPCLLIEFQPWKSTIMYVYFKIYKSMYNNNNCQIFFEEICQCYCWKNDNLLEIWIYVILNFHAFPDFEILWKKKGSHFDLKNWDTGGTKIRPGIPSIWRIFKSNWLKNSHFDLKSWVTHNLYHVLLSLKRGTVSGWNITLFNSLLCKRLLRPFI